MRLGRGQDGGKLNSACSGRLASNDGHEAINTPCVRFLPWVYPMKLLFLLTPEPGVQ